jgi:hydroxypyruvate reductase
VENRVIGSAQQSLQAAAEYFQERAIQGVILGDSVTGEAREVAKVLGAIARQVRKHGNPWRPPVALISGGECTGNRARQRSRGAAVPNSCWHWASISTHCPRSMRSPATPTVKTVPKTMLERFSLRTRWPAALPGSFTLREALDENDAYSYFAAVDALVMTGPTRTNVNDYRVVLVR